MEIKNWEELLWKHSFIASFLFPSWHVCGCLWVVLFDKVYHFENKRSPQRSNNILCLTREMIYINIQLERQTKQQLVGYVKTL